MFVFVEKWGVVDPIANQQVTNQFGSPRMQHGKNK
jgi:hypothetical protein